MTVWSLASEEVEREEEEEKECSEGIFNLSLLGFLRLRFGGRGMAQRKRSFNGACSNGGGGMVLAAKRWSG